MTGAAASFISLERANRRQAAILIAGQVFVFAAFGFGFDLIFHGLLFGNGWNLGFPWFTLAALAFGAIYTARTYVGGAGMVLGAVRAAPIADDEPKKKILQDVVREMSVAARLLEPRLFMIDDPAPNAMAVGRNPQDSVICVTRGLVEALDREELQGVIAHEMAHIRAYDAWLATLVTATRLGRIGSLPEQLYRTLTRGTGTLLSRENEYLADAAAVEFTRNPTALIRALDRIAKTAAPLKCASPAVAPLFFVDPMRSASDEYPRITMPQAESTHPPLADRIARLRRLIGAAGDSKREALSDGSARFTTNLSTNNPAMAAKVIESALLAAPMGRRTMEERLGGEVSSEGAAGESSDGPRKGTGDLAKGSTGELRNGDAVDLNAALDGNGKPDPAAMEAAELGAISRLTADVLPQPPRPYRPKNAFAGASDEASSSGLMLVAWVVFAVSAAAIAMTLFVK